MKIIQITIAAVNLMPMVRFYNQVFDADLTPVNDEQMLFRGQLGGISLLICDNALPQIQADKNRQQFHFAVDDIQAVLTTAVEVGGRIYQPLKDNTASIADPDGNTIVLVQADS